MDDNDYTVTIDNGQTVQIYGRSIIISQHQLTLLI
jgi:hypothetical protein